MKRFWTTGVVILMATGCQLGRSVDQPVPSPSPPAYAAELTQIAETYAAYGRVDDQTRWAPYMCAMPSAGSIRVSKAETDATHGRKLYTVFAKDRDAYLEAVQTGASPVGQVLVKESWHPVQVDESNTEMNGFPYSSMRRTARTEDGQLWKMGKKAGLFVMLKKDADTEGTDAGWVYATIDAENHILESGAIEVCVECHQQAPQGRLFGMN